MTIEIDGKERALLYWGLCLAKVQAQDYIRDYESTTSALRKAVEDEIKQIDEISDRLYK